MLPRVLRDHLQQYTQSQFRLLPGKQTRSFDKRREICFKGNVYIKHVGSLFVVVEKVAAKNIAQGYGLIQFHSIKIVYCIRFCKRRCANLFPLVTRVSSYLL